MLSEASINNVEEEFSSNIRLLGCGKLLDFSERWRMNWKYQWCNKYGTVQHLTTMLWQLSPR